ncbi:MAG: hypothetical protein ACTSR8_11190 [Promethearchaeota archaeon]
MQILFTFNFFLNLEVKEYQVIAVAPRRCNDCETCMSICALVHESKYIPLEKRIIGGRMRMEPEWAIACDICEGMKEEFVDPKVGREPQCISACPRFAIFITTIEAFKSETRIEAIKREFSIKKKNLIYKK